MKLESGMQVESLRDKRVTQVACGAWHTAAIAAPRPQGPSSVDDLPFIERLALQHTLAAMYELTDEVGAPGRLAEGWSPLPRCFRRCSITDSLKSHCEPTPCSLEGCGRQCHAS